MCTRSSYRSQRLTEFNKQLQIQEAHDFWLTNFSSHYRYIISPKVSVLLLAEDSALKLFYSACLVSYCEGHKDLPFQVLVLPKVPSLVFSSRITHAKAHGVKRDCNILLLLVTGDMWLWLSQLHRAYRQSRLLSVCLDLVLVTTKKIKIKVTKYPEWWALGTAAPSCSVPVPREWPGK